MIVLTLLLSAVLLACEGFLLSSLVLRTKDEQMLRWSLGLPLGSLLNAFVFTALDIAGIRWTVLSVWGVHLLLLAALFFFWRRISHSLKIERQRAASLPRWIGAVSVIILVCVGLPAAIHALTIPSIGWDSFTNWAMRAKLSFEGGRFVSENVVQPQYPVLFHSLLMLPMFGAGWSDQATKIIGLLFDLSAIMALWSMVRILAGSRGATLLLAVLACVPLVSMQLRQGYADLHWTLLAILSVAAFTLSENGKHQLWILLSALLMTAAAWTKLEGLYIGLLPWLLVLGLQLLKTKKRTCFINPMILAAVLSAVWPLLTFLRGSAPVPHAVSLQFHPEAAAPMMNHLFFYGSFGMQWWCVVLLLILCLCRKNLRGVFALPLTQAGLFAFAGLLLGYFFTPEVRGLLQGDNIARAMTMPTLMLSSALTLFFLHITPSRRGAGA